MLMRFMAAAVACCAALSQGAIVEVAPVESNATPVVCAPGYASAGLMRSPESELAKFQSALDAGEFCMVGEFGCRPDVPHDVALAWMEHCLKLWKESGLLIAVNIAPEPVKAVISLPDGRKQEVSLARNGVFVGKFGH